MPVETRLSLNRSISTSQQTPTLTMAHSPNLTLPNALAIENLEEEKCGKCNSLVKDEDKGLECNICNQWFHITCEGISDNLYEVLSDNNISNIHWFCTSCNRVANGILTNISKVLRNQDSFVQELKVVQSDIADNSKNISLIQATVVDNTNNISSAQGAMATCVTDVKSNTDNIASLANDIKALNTQFNNLLSEPTEYAKRKLNIIVAGLPENVDDTESSKNLVSKVFNLLEIECEFEEVIRLGKIRTDGKPRFVRVTLKSLKDKDNILSKAKLIKDKPSDDLPFAPGNIYISSDQTRLQRYKAYQARVAKRTRQNGNNVVPQHGNNVVPHADAPPAAPNNIQPVIGQDNGVNGS